MRSPDSNSVQNSEALAALPQSQRLLRVPKGSKPFFPPECLRTAENGEDHVHLATFSLQPEHRQKFRQRLANIMREHVIDPQLLEQLGDQRAALLLRTRIPGPWRTRLGDLGEILAAEYTRHTLNCSITYRLRSKQNVHLPLHGIDCIGLRLHANRLLIVKGEAKMRAYLKAEALEEAHKTLETDAGAVPADQLAAIAIWHRKSGDTPLSDAVIQHLAGESTVKAFTRHFLFAGYEKAVDTCLDHLFSLLDRKRKTYIATLEISGLSQFIDGVYEASVEALGT